MTTCVVADLRTLKADGADCVDEVVRGYVGRFVLARCWVKAAHVWRKVHSARERFAVITLGGAALQLVGDRPAGDHGRRGIQHALLVSALHARTPLAPIRQLTADDNVFSLHHLCVVDRTGWVRSWNAIIDSDVFVCKLVTKTSISVRPSFILML